MTAKIITVFNQKGGCAKTMTSIQLAGTFGSRGLNVFLIDMDPQNTSALWALNADPDTPFPATVMSFAPLKEHFVEKVPAIAEKNDLIIIDCPPSLDSQVPWAALTMLADFAIIPVMPVLDNVWASRQAEDLLIKARQSRAAKGFPDLPGAFLLSAVKRGKVYETCAEELRKKAELPILNSSIGNLNAFPESQVYGCVVGSFGKSSAAKQIDALVDELARLMKLSFPKKARK